MVNMGPPSITPGEYPGGIILHIYTEARLVHRTAVREGDDIETIARRDADATLAALAAEGTDHIWLVAYDGDTGERMEGLTFG